MNKLSIEHSVIAPILAVIILLVFEQTALGLVNGSITKSKPGKCSPAAVPMHNVDVWNNVIDVERIAPLLHEESRRNGFDHKVFSRSSLTTPSNTGSSIIEQTLDSILTELNDNSKYVEYWTRREWRSIEAHADVDEYRAKTEQQLGETKNKSFRYPRNGHVLYLQVGSNVRGPTCVFPNRRSGGDLLRKEESIVDPINRVESCVSSSPDDGDSNITNEHNKLPSMQEKEDGVVELVTVPAVPGRLLRFQGDYLHAVPRPTDLWLLNFVKGSPTFEPEEDWGRSVILFNTWDDEPPLGLPVDEGNNGDFFTGNDHSNNLRYNCNRRNQWCRAIPSSPPLPLPPQDESHKEPKEDDDHLEHRQPPLLTKIWLLGDYRRRDYKMQTVKLEGTESLREALYQESNVMSTKLNIPS